MGTLQSGNRLPSMTTRIHRYVGAILCTCHISFRLHHASSASHTILAPTYSANYTLSSHLRILDCVLRKPNGDTWIEWIISIRQSIIGVIILLILCGYITGL